MRTGLRLIDETFSRVHAGRGASVPRRPSSRVAAKQALISTSPNHNRYYLHYFLTARSSNLTACMDTHIEHFTFETFRARSMPTGIRGRPNSVRQRWFDGRGTFIALAFWLLQ